MGFTELFDEIDGTRNVHSQLDLQRFKQTWNAPLSATELDELRGNEQKPHWWNLDQHGVWQPRYFTDWSFPQRDFPALFLELIREYGGCGFVRAEREFNLFDIDDLRTMNLAYELPQYMPGAVSFGLDGGGNHLIFDMRAEKPANNYEVWGAHSGYLEWEGAKLIATDFQTFIQGTKSVDDLMNGY